MTHLRFARLTTAGTITAALFAGSALAQDSCGTATAISAINTYIWDNTGFTDSGAAPGAPCVGADGVTNGAIEKDFWFSWTVPAAGDYRLDTIGTGDDTILQASIGPCGAEVCVAYNDDINAAFESQIDIPGQLGGEVYLLQLGQWQGQAQAQGPGVLNVGLIPPAHPNDTCATPDAATLAAGTGTFGWSNIGASSSDFVGGGSPCVAWGPGGAAVRDDIFMTWTCPANGAYSFDTGGTGTDTILSIHDGSDCLATCLAHDDDGLNPFPTFGESRIVLPGQTTGQVRLIQLGLWNGNAQTSTGFLTIGTVSPPANDTCVSPTVISVGSTFYDSTITSTSNFTGASGGAPAPGSGDDPGSDLFYEFTSPNTSWYQIDTLGTAEDTVINVYDGVACAATYLQNSDNEGSLQSRVFVDSGATGPTYLIQVGGWQSETTAAGILNITEMLPAPGPGNECSTAIAVGVGTTAFDNTGMTTEGFSDGGGGACPTGFITGMPKQDMFFQFTAPADGDYRFDTLGSGQDTVMMLHQGVGCVATCLAYNDEALPVTAGESRAYAAGLLTGDNILVQVGTWAHTDVPTGVLNINAEAPLTNDDCSTPLAIAGEGVTNFNLEHPSITSSGFEGGDPINCPAGIVGNGIGDGVEGDVFFAWTAQCDGDYQFSTDPTTGVVDTVISVHSGSDCTATCLAANDDIVPGAGGNFLSSVIISGVLSGETLLIQVGMADEILLSGPAQLTVTNLLGACPSTGIVEVACSPASTHLGGGQATMTTSTFGAATPSGLQLQVTDGSPGEFGFFLVAGDHTNNIALFNGVLCMDTPFGRYNPNIANNQGFPQLNSIGQFDGSGVFQSLFGNAPSTGGSGFDVPVQLPFSPAGQVITPGDTWAFQCWFRDGASANFSDSIKVNF